MVDLNELRELILENQANDIKNIQLQNNYYDAMSTDEKHQINKRFLEVTGIPIHKFSYIERTGWDNFKWLMSSSNTLREIVLELGKDVDLITPEINELEELQMLHLQSLSVQAAHFYEMAKSNFFEDRNNPSMVSRSLGWNGIYPVTPINQSQIDIFGGEELMKIWVWKKIFSERPRATDYWFCHFLIIESFKSAKFSDQDVRCSGSWKLFFPKLIDRIEKAMELKIIKLEN